MPANTIQVTRRLFEKNLLVQLKWLLDESWKLIQKLKHLFTSFETNNQPAQRFVARRSKLSINSGIESAISEDKRKFKHQVRLKTCAVLTIGGDLQLRRNRHVADTVDECGEHHGVSRSLNAEVLRGQQDVEEPAIRGTLFSPPRALASNIS